MPTSDKSLDFKAFLLSADKMCLFSKTIPRRFSHPFRVRYAHIIHDKVHAIFDTDLDDKKNMQTAHSKKEIEMSDLIAEYEAEKKKLFGPSSKTTPPYKH